SMNDNYNFTVGAYFKVRLSTNGGLTWSNHEFADETYGYGYDPMVAFDATGRLYVTYVSSNGPVLYWKDENFSTFDNSAASFDGHDKMVLATGYDPVTSGQAVYVSTTSITGSFFVYGSNDGGVTFTGGLILSSDLPLGSIAVGPAGDVYLCDY